MKRYVIVLLCVLLVRTAAAQTDAIEQLRLNIEKLAQLKAMLENMVSGYRMLEKGYNNLQQQSLANYTLHKSYLEDLWKPGEQVKKEPALDRIDKTFREIIATVVDMIRTVGDIRNFTSEETKDITRVAGKIATAAKADKNELDKFIKPGKLQMQDAERLARIGEIDAKMTKHWFIARSLMDQVQQLKQFREVDRMDIQTLRRLNNQKKP